MLRIEKDVTPEHLAFIEANGSGRIRGDTYQAYTNLCFARRRGDEDIQPVIIVTYRYNDDDQFNPNIDWDDILSLSASILEGLNSTRNITITRKGYRKKGLGGLVLATRLSLLTNYSFQAIVASDNVASNRLVTRCGMMKIGERELTRDKGPYKALIYSP